MGLGRRLCRLGLGDVQRLIDGGVQIGKEQQLQLLAALGKFSDKGDQLLLFVDVGIGVEKLHQAAEVLLLHQAGNQVGQLLVQVSLVGAQ